MSGGGRLALVAASALLLAAWLVAAHDRLALAGVPAAAFVLLAPAALLVRFPFAASCLVFFAVPFFGNHPGGRWVELLNVPVAAAALGLSVRARRRPRPLVPGPLPFAALAVLVTAALALFPALPAALLRAAQANDARLALVQALVAAEGDPLYSVGSFLQLALCVTWALALRAAGADAAFAHRAVRATMAGLVVVMGLGALRFHGLLDLRRLWFDVVDPNLHFDDPMQSIFWNPGWLAGYFALAFGLSLGLLWLERPAGRLAAAAALVPCLGYFLLSRQRAGLAAAAAIVLLAAWLAAAHLPRPRRLLAVGGAAAIVVAALAAAASLASDAWQTGASRLLSVPGLDEHRHRLWLAALAMWREAPLFGIGEGSFCWRYPELVARGAALEVPFTGDAHNTWLQVLATRGLLGLLALGALAFAAGGAVRRALAGRGGVPRGLGVGLACSLLGALVYSLVQGLFYVQALQVLFWGVVALASLSDDRPSPGAGIGRGAVVSGLALVLLARVATAWPAFEGLGGDLSRRPRGFYSARRVGEEVTRWSSRQGVLCLYPDARVVHLAVSPGRRPPHLSPVVVTFRVGRRLVDRLVLDRPGPVELSLAVPEGAGVRPPPGPLLPGECSPDAEPLRLEVEASSVFSRMMAKDFEDYRHLGVMITLGSR